MHLFIQVATLLSNLKVLYACLYYHKKILFGNGIDCEN